MKDSKQLERYLKGAAHHHRIEILRLVYKDNNVTLEEISEFTGADVKTLSEHTTCLAIAGLLSKSQGKHTLSPYGKRFIELINLF